MLLPAFQNSTLYLHVSKPKIGDLLLLISRAPLRAYFVELDKMQVNIQGVEHDLRRIEQIYSKLHNNEDAASV